MPCCPCPISKSNQKIFTLIDKREAVTSTVDGTCTSMIWTAFVRNRETNINSAVVGVIIVFIFDGFFWLLCWEKDFGLTIEISPWQRSLRQRKVGYKSFQISQVLIPTKSGSAQLLCSDWACKAKWPSLAIIARQWHWQGWSSRAPLSTARAVLHKQTSSMVIGFRFYKKSRHFRRGNNGENNLDPTVAPMKELMDWIATASPMTELVDSHVFLLLLNLDPSQILIQIAPINSPIRLPENNICFIQPWKYLNRGFRHEFGFARFNILLKKCIPENLVPWQQVSSDLELFLDVATQVMEHNGNRWLLKVSLQILSCTF